MQSTYIESVVIKHRRSSCNKVALTTGYTHQIIHRRCILFVWYLPPTGVNLTPWYCNINDNQLYNPDCLLRIQLGGYSNCVYHLCFAICVLSYHQQVHLYFLVSCSVSKMYICFGWTSLASPLRILAFQSFVPATLDLMLQGFVQRCLPMFGLSPSHFILSSVCSWGALPYSFGRKPRPRIYRWEIPTLQEPIGF